MFFTFPTDFKILKLHSGVAQHLIWGDKVMLSYNRYAHDLSVPLHKHPYEQLMILIEGGMSFRVGEETQIMKPNDAVLIPPNVEHGSTGVQSGSVVISVMSPPAEDLKNA